MSAIFVGLTLGVIFGAASRAGRFCLLRGMKGLMGRGELAPLRAFALALAVALVGTQTLNHFGLTDLSASLPLRGQFAAGGLAIGGALFGLGMVLANACGARALVLLAGGNLRSLLVLLCLGLAAQASLTGVLSGARQALQIGQFALPALSVTDWVVSLGFSRMTALILATGVPAFLLLLFAMPLIRQGRLEALMAIVIGLCVTAGWWAAWATDDPFDPKILNSLSFIAPVGDALLWLMLSTGRAAGFTLGIIAGTMIGAFAVAILSRSFALETFGSGKHSLYAVVGGLLMGFGGVLAMGCSIGQALSGVSTLSLASLVATLGILAGSVVGLVFVRQ